MRKVSDIKTTSYYTGHEDFIIDIIENNQDDPMFETWLYREKTGTKIYVVGEFKKYYPGMSVDEYAKHIVKYIRTRTKKGYTFYGIYDEHIEDVELAAWQRIKQERQSAPN